MNLFEAVAEGLPYVIDHPDGGRRILAAVIPWPGGVGFADTFYPDATRPPFHFVAGKVTGEPPSFRVGSCPVTQIFQGDPLWPEWQGWLAWLKDHPEADTSPERIRAGVNWMLNG